MKGIVLLHGAGLGSYIWEDMIPLMKYPILAVDFPNRQTDGQINKSLTFDAYMNPVIEQIRQWNHDQVVLVSHSIGGIVGMKTAEVLGDRIVGLAGISAAIPEEGKSFVTSLPFPKNLFIRMVINTIGTKPPDSAITSGLCNDLSEEQTVLIVDRFTPESKALYLEKINATVKAPHRLYVKLSQDQEYPMVIQEKMAKNLEAQQIITLESGHLPMMSLPEQMADILNDFTDQC